MNLKNLGTPCLILDKYKLQENINSLHQHMGKLGTNLRPHGKTAKNIDIARMALEGQSGGITVSTVKEAEYYFDHGISDIVYAVGIVENKLDRLIRLIKKDAKITVILDSVEQVPMLSAKAQEYDVVIPALIEIDCDGHRSGVKPDSPLLTDIGQLLKREKGVSLAGILTHAGESYHCNAINEIRNLARVEAGCCRTMRPAIAKQRSGLSGGQHWLHTDCGFCRRPVRDYRNSRRGFYVL